MAGSGPKNNLRLPFNTALKAAMNRLGYLWKALVMAREIKMAADESSGSFSL